MYFPPEVEFLRSWANFQAGRLYKSNDTYQYKCGGVEAYKKGRGLASGCCPSLKNAWAKKTSRIARKAKRLFWGEFSV